MARQLFGTDGIRGQAGEYPLDARTAHAVGAVLGEWAGQVQPGAEVVIGMDTRESGPWLAAQVAGGLRRRGVPVRFAGLITTPGVAWLTRSGPFVAGVMISASHNPFQDNGIKIFDHSGYKLPDELEHALEEKIFAQLDQDLEPQAAGLAVDEGLDRSYVDYLAGTAAGNLHGMRLVVDCANGAAAHLAPELFEKLGARVTPIACTPDGRNINEDCGALHVEALRLRVLAERAHAGVAFDGDADRAILVSERGAIIDGDCVLLIAGRALLGAGRLRGPNGCPTVVATVMSNLGLERAFTGLGVRLLRTAVGDKYVLEEMKRCGANLGGEQSGHVIFHDHATTGDGMLTALRVLEIAQRAGAGIDDLVRDLEIYPQRLVNVRVRNRKPLGELAQAGAEIRAAEQAFGAAGRVLVRFSGTEPLVRVMVEGPDLERVESFAGRIAQALHAELG
ncbi:MAG: phosphoglucosamine mutase [Acidobacteria bacterium]|nr:phosphoglucosamine mutase [Acidobacteriota bacterium]